MSSSTLNIIIVEDIPIQRKLMVSTLHREGHHITAVESTEAFDNIRVTKHIDLLITDLNLPGESGFSLAQRFHQAQPDSGIIMVSALNQAEAKVSGYDHGADIYLTKPITPDELIAAVNALSRRLNKVQSQSEAKEESLTLYPERLILQGRYKTVALSRSETLILSGLTRAPDHMLEPTQICRLLGLEAASYSKSALEVRFVRLRKKIIEAGYTLPAIKKVRKKGYQLSVPLQII